MVSAPQEVHEPVRHRDLPDELWAMVLQFLMKVDIKSTRLVCKRFDCMTIPLLYNVVIVAPHRKDLEVFDAIAGHEVYSKCVQELVYSAAEFNGYEMGHYEMEHYETDLRDQVFEEDEAHLLTEAVIAQGFAVYTRYATEQEEIQDDNEDFAHLCMNLPSLKRLERVKFLESWLEFLTKEEVNFKRYQSVLDPSPKSHGFVQRHWNPLHLEPRTADCITMHRAFRTVLRALSITQTRVKQVVHCGSIPQLLFTTMMSDATLRHAIQVFQHLRKLVLTSDCGSRYIGIRTFAKLLSAAARLEDLCLRFGSPYKKPCRGNIELVFGHQTWLHLRALTLQGFSFRFAELHDFLGRHSEPLRLMTLSNCDLQYGSWTDVVDFLRSDMKLSKCAITKVRDADGKEVPTRFLNWKILNEYLWHGGKNPLREAQALSCY